MQLNIRPHHSNNHPLQGVLIKGDVPSYWAKEIQAMQLELGALEVFAIPSTVANVLWGCLLVMHKDIKTEAIGRNEYCQLVGKLLFIPEYTQLMPRMLKHEIKHLLQDRMHIFHPDFGYLALGDPINWAEIIEGNLQKEASSMQPEEPVAIPERIQVLKVHSIPPEQALKQMMDDAVPENKKFKDKPLNMMEKAKLKFYQQLFKKDKNQDPRGSGQAIEEGNSLFEKFGNLFKETPQTLRNMQQDFEELERRNKEAVDKLMDLFKDNPEEALKYAIPLDQSGTARGGDQGYFNLNRRWNNFSLFGSDRRTGSGSAELGDHYFELRKQYNETAEGLIEKEAYEKAAFIYLKLLQNPYQAALTLEKGAFYQEAASIYLKHLNNKEKAAECYETGNFLEDAIRLYKDINNHEKVGDLYIKLNNFNDANTYFNKVADDYKTKRQYVKASLIYRKKMNDPDLGQSILMEGWQKNIDSFNCINNYFSNIKDVELLGEAIDQVYQKEVNRNNRKTFLKALKHEFNKRNDLAPQIKDMAYEIISTELENNPGMASELAAFNTKDKSMIKDIIRFRTINKS